MQMSLSPGLQLALSASGQAPTEFPVFQSGPNDTEKGTFYFDAKAAKWVMAAYKKWGVDLMIDLEHLSLDDRPSPDPTSKDARGWCQLELRPDGSLWAVKVRWTPDGAARLREKRQRYISPAFEAEAGTNRIVKIVNIAITALPATHGTPALVAASAKPTPAPKPPSARTQIIATGLGRATLTASEIATCREVGCDPRTFAENKLRRLRGLPLVTKGSI